jgi:NAD(P)-dependent dehydrogenase (short-subunit alcohol dehydrogenase family)
MSGRNTYVDPYDGNGMFKSFTKTWHNKPYSAISPTRPELSMRGKVIFVTGGGTGIGKAIAIAFAQAGAKGVAIFGRRMEKIKGAAEEIRRANSQGTTTVAFESVDLSKRKDVEKAFASALKTIGVSQIDVFVSNAATAGPRGKFFAFKEADFREYIDFSIITAFNAVHSAKPHLTSNAKLINISSGIGHLHPLPEQSAYAAMKAAITKLFDYIQVENPDLDVYCIQPGVVETEVSDGYAKGQDEGKASSSRQLQSRGALSGSDWDLNCCHLLT